jgi:hypothetical protein
VWAFASDGSQLRFDPRILEDSQGGAFVVAGRELHATGTAVHAEYGSARVPYAGSAGPPPSRGAPCTLQLEGRPPAALDPCPLTDGDFIDVVGGTVAAAEPATTAGGGPAAAASATVDLRSARPLALVVVRGCACEVETSADGSAWTSLGRTPAADASVVPPRPTTARFVRVRTTGSLAELREVSVWEVQPGAAGVVFGASPGTGGAAAPASRPRARTAWLVAAALALALAGGAVGAVGATTVVRRRSSR